LADDDADGRQALRLLLERQLDFRVVGEAAHAHGLVALVDASQADLVLLDWKLPGGVDAWLLADLHRIAHRPHIIVLGSHPDQKAAAIAAGADAFADKGSTPERLIDAATARDGQ
jgi:DNA-binding NarL/FixJ family response regulator